MRIKIGEIVKSKIKSVIFSTIMLLVVFAPAYGASASTFNNDSQDDPTFSISNYTKNPGCSTCWVSSVSADAGEIVSFDIYYHNTGNQTANNVTLKVVLPSGSFTGANIPVVITDQAGGQASGSVSLSLSSTQTVTFIPGSVRWYPNRTLTAQTLPSGQNGSEVVGQGLNIGDIAPGWGTQGHVVFRAQVGSASQPQVNAPTASSASATNISVNSATLNANVNPNGLNTNAWFEYGVSPGFLSNMSSSQNAGSGNSNLNVSSGIFGLSSNTTYYFRAVAQNSAGTNYGNVLSFNTNIDSVWGGNTGQAPIVNTNFASNISRDRATLNASVNPNASFTNSWFEYGTSPSSMNLSSSIQSVGSGNFNYNTSSSILNLLPNTTYYFRIVAQNSNNIAYGNTLSFTTGFAEGTSALGPNVTTLEASNTGLTMTVLNAMVNPNNISTDVWFEYSSASDSASKMTPVRSAGQSNYAIKVSAEVRDLLPNTLYDFRIVGKNLYGTNYGSKMSFITSLGGVRAAGLPSVFTKPASSITSSSAILDASVNPNNSSTNVWFEYGASAGLLGSKTIFRNAGAGNNYVDAPIIAGGLSPNTTYYFRPAAQNSQGVSYGAVNTFTTVGVKTGATPTPVAGSFSPLFVRFEVDKSEVNIGGELKYRIVVKNSNSSLVKGVQLSLGMPENIEVRSYDAPLLSGGESGILSANLGIIGAGEEIIKEMAAQIREGAKIGDVLTAIASVNYQDSSGKSQPSISLSASSVVGDGLGLGASVFGALKSLSFSDWIILVLFAALAVISVLLFNAKKSIKLK